MGIESILAAWRLRPRAVSALSRFAFSVLSVILAIHWARNSLPRYFPKDWSKAHEYDTLQDWIGARLYMLGKNPYSPEGLNALNAQGFGHPPTAPFWLLPLAPFDKPIAAEVMDLSTWFLLVVHIYICARAVRFPSAVALTVLLFGWSLTVSGFVAHWHAIQSSEQIAFSLVLCWFFLRQRRDVAAGAALGFAGTLKLFPGVLFVFLLLARRYRAFLAATAVYAGVAAVMTLGFGLDAWRLFFVQQGPAADAWVGDVRNASIHGIVLRLLYPVCEYPSPAPTAVSKAAGIALSVALLVMAALVSRRACERARETAPYDIDVPFALFTVIAVLVNPWVWNHYWVLLIQPAFVVMSTLYASTRDASLDWLDEVGSGRALALSGATLVGGGLGIASIVELLHVQDMPVTKLVELWNATKSPWAHRQLHFYEVYNWLPWVIMLGLCVLTVNAAERARQRHRHLALAPRARLFSEPEHSPWLRTD